MQAGIRVASDMNFLAHAFLAPDSSQARIGSIMGDFTRGLDLDTLPDEVRRGVTHHFAVDRFTDQHPQVRASKRLFSPERRRFSGVALDVLYDHYLLRHWHGFSRRDPGHFVQQLYRELRTHEAVMPARMRETTRHMVRHDWFTAYRDLGQVGLALDRIAARIRYPNRFQGILEEILTNRQELEERFLIFFPELQKCAGDF